MRRRGSDNTDTSFRVHVETAPNSPVQNSNAQEGPSTPRKDEQEGRRRLSQAQPVGEQDEVESCGRCLLLNLLSELLQRLSHVIVTCEERSPKFFKSWLPHDVQHKVRFIQPPPPCQSNEGGKGDGNDDNHNMFHDISKMVESLGQQQQSSVGVVVDSLSPTLFVSDAPAVCQAIHKLCRASTVNQVVAVFHRDVHEESTHRLLTHQASSVLELGPGPQGTHQTCQVRHCRQTGKVLKSAEVFRVDDQFSIVDIQPLSKLSKSGPEPSPQPDKNDPTSNLTFNLSLTDAEKEARSQVVLPYLKDRSKPEEPVASQSRIYYQADDVDDLDEEDPDDDLNI